MAGDGREATMTQAPGPAPGSSDGQAFARTWPVLSAVADRAGLGRTRARLVSGLAGVVVEVGAGRGVTFANYTATVSRVVAVETDHHQRYRAERADVRVPPQAEAVHVC